MGIDTARHCVQNAIFYGGWSLIGQHFEDPEAYVLPGKVLFYIHEQYSVIKNNLLEVVTRKFSSRFQKFLFLEKKISPTRKDFLALKKISEG